MSNSFPALQPLIQKLDDLTPKTTPPSQAAAAPGTLVVRRAVIPWTDPSPNHLLGSAGNHNTINLTENHVGKVDSPYYLNPYTCVVRLGPTYFYGVPWVGDPPHFGDGFTTTADIADTNTGMDGQVLVLSQPPFMVVLGNVSGTDDGGPPWTQATLLSGFLNTGTVYPLTSYRRVGDMLQIRGQIYSSTGTIFDLPSGLWPPYTHRFATVGAGSFAEVEVTTGGVVSLVSGTTTYPGVSLALPPMSMTP